MHKLIGAVIIVDGIWSLYTWRNRHDWFTDVGRMVRIVLGVMLLLT